MMLVWPCQKKVATIASPWCGFVGLNPLMRVVPCSLNAAFHWSGGPPVEGGGGAGGAGALMLNAALVAPVTVPVVVACRVYPFPALSMLRVEKVATPLAAVTVRVPESAPPLGFVPTATGLAPVKLGSVLPALSLADT